MINPQEQINQIRHWNIQKFLWPYMLAAGIWIGIFAYYSLFKTTDLPTWQFVPSIILFHLMIIGGFVQAVISKNVGNTIGWGIYLFSTSIICFWLLPYHISFLVAIIIATLELGGIFALLMAKTSVIKEHYAL